MLKAYEEARAWSLANPAELKKILVAYTKLPEAVIDRQLERTELTHSHHRQAAGGHDPGRRPRAAAKPACIAADTNVKAAVDDLIDRRFATATAD